MDISVLIVLWMVFVVAQGILQKKNPPPSPPQDNSSPDFEIPTLANDPNFPGEDVPVLITNTRQAAEVREINLAEIYRQKKIAAQAEKISQPKAQPQEKFFEEVEQESFSLNLTPSSAMNAIVLSEILGKPKCKR